MLSSNKIRLLVLGPAFLTFSVMAQSQPQSCPNDESGLKLPAGFCATVFADGIGHARHLVVAPNGVLYVNTWSEENYGSGKPREDGFLVALEDKTGKGKADRIERFGETVKSGGAGGTGIGIYKGWIYAEINDRIVRYPLPKGALVPSAPPETIVSGLPLGGDHPMHPFFISDDGKLYVNVGTATNACQAQNRQPKVPGASPCKELETRGGIWLFDANKTNQKFSPAERFATGIRNAEGFAIDSAGHIFITQHGRDQLHTNWPEFYKASEEATLPAEELMLLKAGGDYGWPECYYDPGQKKLVLAPEYGGDGGKKVGVARAKPALSPRFQRTGDRMARRATTRNNFRRAIATAFSSPFTVHGIARLTRKVDTTSSSNRSPVCALRGAAKFSRTVSLDR